jgi:hypothetical protein
MYVLCDNELRRTGDDGEIENTAQNRSLYERPTELLEKMKPLDKLKHRHNWLEIEHLSNLRGGSKILRGL